jgi:hypothetical protein
MLAELSATLADLEREILVKIDEQEVAHHYLPPCDASSVEAAKKSIHNYKITLQYWRGNESLLERVFDRESWSYTLEHPWTEGIHDDTHKMNSEFEHAFLTGITGNEANSKQKQIMLVKPAEEKIEKLLVELDEVGTWNWFSTRWCIPNNWGYFEAGTHWHKARTPIKEKILEIFTKLCHECDH